MLVSMPIVNQRRSHSRETAQERCDLVDLADDIRRVLALVADFRLRFVF